MNDPEIKLFGKKIALPENGKIPVVSGHDPGGEYMDTRFDDTDAQHQEAEKDHLTGEPNESKPQDMAPSPITDESTDQKLMPESNENLTTSIDEESAASKSPNTENDPTQKKPDKILPCPRCNSMDTKFCYYNNYNVNQPRHFCKSCQRYWTAGGTMRNVPVGAGRRKNKNPASHCRHITISEALHTARIDARNGIDQHHTFKINGTDLSFGTDLPICEPMASVLNLAEKKEPNGTLNGLPKVEPGIAVSFKGGENGNNSSNGSSVTHSNSTVEEGRNGLRDPKIQSINCYPYQIPCLAGVTWPYPWNSAVPVPAICPPGFPIAYLPAPYWNCNIPATCNIPWLCPISPTTNQNSSTPTLGKHSRDGELLSASNPEVKESVEQKKSEGSILIPKTLRIDDPDEAAKSSIWATLGIKHESVNKGGFFKSFQPKGDKKNHSGTNSPLFQANPAALSRSLCFQETA